MLSTVETRRSETYGAGRVSGPDTGLGTAVWGRVCAFSSHIDSQSTTHDVFLLKELPALHQHAPNTGAWIVAGDVDF